MKKIILILVSILLFVGIILSIFGSGGNYAAEKLFYRAMKINSKIAANPDVAPPALLAAVENNLKQLLKKYPKANAAKMAHMALAEFYISNEKYVEAFNQIKTIAETYFRDSNILSSAQFLKGLVYEKQSRWDRALAEYTILRDKYPNTKLGIGIPIYIGRYYDSKNMRAEADKAYNDAIAFYTKMEKENFKKPLGYIASTMLLQSYLNLKDFDGAGRILGATINNYPSDGVYAQLSPYVELVFVRKMNQPEKAVAVYKDIKLKTKDEKLVKLLEKRIEKLEKKY